MYGGMTANIFSVLAGAGLIMLAALLWIVIGWRRRTRRQSQLAKGFDRARIVQQTGSGIQGTPYSVYGVSAWSGDGHKKK